MNNKILFSVLFVPSLLLVPQNSFAAFSAQAHIDQLKQSKPNQGIAQSVPKELITHCFGFCDEKTVRRGSRVNKLWHVAALDALKKKATAHSQAITLGERPTAVQNRIDQVFKEISNSYGNNWLFNGHDFYGLLNLDDDLVLENLASRYPNDKDIYIIDVGCAGGDWGYHATRLLNKEAQKIDKHFHIFSITGGNELDLYGIIKKEDGTSILERYNNKVVQTKNVTHYLFNQFKVENIDEEFRQRGFDLKNKIHLIVSRWTLRHLVDPFGTLKRMYSLLTPSRGMLMSNGFFFALDDQENTVLSIPNNYSKENTMWDIIAATNALSLFRNFDSNRDVGQFLLMRTNEKELGIPLSYTGEMRKLPHGYQNDSETITVLKKETITQATPFYFKLILEDNAEQAEQEDGLRKDGSYAPIYCDHRDEKSKQLYADLKHQGFICKSW